VLYAVELNQPAEAEALLNRALAVSTTEQIAWSEESQVYQALLSLYRSQPNKQREIEQTYLGKLEAIKRATKYNSYRTPAYPLFMADYFTTIAEVAAFYLEQKDVVHAEEIYRLYSERRDPFMSRLNDSKKLEEMAVSIEKCQALLRKLGKPEEAAKLDEIAGQTRERQKVVEAKQKENEATPKAP
jgi:DNA-binding transcriptional MerR regulator